jgi:hypothetical protein
MRHVPTAELSANRFLLIGACGLIVLILTLLFAAIK